MEMVLGEVYTPDGLLRKGKRKPPGIGPEPLPHPLPATDLGQIIQELRELRADVERIKRALTKRGILV